MRRFLEVWNNEDGSELVEFVLVVPLLMTILAYMLCFCQIIYAGQVALNASNSGVRYAVMQSNRSSAYSTAAYVAESNVNSAGMGVSFRSSDMNLTDIYGNGASWRRGNVCNFSVSVSVDTIMPMGIFNSRSTVTKASHMIIESD